MAIAIRSTPTLKGEEAAKFVEQAEKTAKESRASIDFTQYIKIAREILAKAKLK